LTGPPGGVTLTLGRGQDPRVSGRVNGQIGGGAEVCPDVLAVCEQLGWTKPGKRRWLQRVYDDVMSNADPDYDFGGHVLTYMTRCRQSRPADLATGERAVRKVLWGRSR